MFVFHSVQRTPLDRGRDKRLPAISFWVMYGLVLTIGLLTPKYSDKQQEHNFKTLWIVLDACAPNDKKEQLREELDAEHENT